MLSALKADSEFLRDNRSLLAQLYWLNSSSKACASFRSAVSKLHRAKHGATGKNHKPILNQLARSLLLGCSKFCFGRCQRIRICNEIVSA